MRFCDFKTSITRPLCLLVSFTFCGWCKGVYSNHICLKIQPSLYHGRVVRNQYIGFDTLLQRWVYQRSNFISPLETLTTNFNPLQFLKECLLLGWQEMCGNQENLENQWSGHIIQTYIENWFLILMEEYGDAQLVSLLPSFLFFHSANNLKIEHFCSISQFLRRRFGQISLRKIILLTLISVRKTLKNFFLFR